MTLVIDSSAVVAILLGETEGERCVRAMARDAFRLMSVANFIETGAVLAGRASPQSRQAVLRDLDNFLIAHGIQLAPVTEEQARTALRARIDFGRGFGAAAGLNFGDCFAYALAKTEGARLLYVGDDFAMTDVERAL